MAREIKFRAKIVMDIEPLAMKKGYWVEGHYYEDLHQGEWCSWIQECDDITHYKVDKNTLGQFTGLLDKNGKEIYEGDIIRSYDSENNPIMHSISWDNKKACYVATMLQYPLLGGSIDKGWIDEFEKEIIGNIYDNPELLKAETL